MRYVKTSLLSVEAVVTYYLTVTVLNAETVTIDTPKVILLTVFVFFWCMATEQNKKSFS